MTLNKIIRSVCYFADEVRPDLFERIDSIVNRLEQNAFEIQTKRICFGGMSIKHVDESVDDAGLFLSVGTLNREQAQEQFDDFIHAGNISFNLDITAGVTLDDVNLLFEMIRQQPSKTFNFTYACNNPTNSPFFPSANYEIDGFSIGLQSTDLSAGCESVTAWLDNMRVVWDELMDLFAEEPDFLGIDSSVAPLFDGDSSFIQFIERVHATLSQAVTTNVFTEITSFLKSQNPKPVGLCGLMFPCLEDAVLARRYEQGEFSMERNLFLALHCGVGIDTYSVGIDESPERVLQILKLLRALSNRYQKPLSARFISDGMTKISGRTDLNNPYLQDVVVRPL